MMKIYSALYYDDAHLRAFGDLEVANEPNDLCKDGILILHGGADISPTIYGKKVNPKTIASHVLSQRDKMEVDLATRAIEIGMPIFGICRGAQLSCALAGGSLVQHVDNHVGHTHEILCENGDIQEVTTCHHQMMNLENTEHELLAWAAPKLSGRYLGEPGEYLEIDREPEVVFFPRIKALAIQGHPEWMDRTHPFISYCLDLVKEKLL